MPHGHSRSTGSSAGAGKGAGNDNSNGGGGVLSRVLGSFRRHSHNGDDTANNKEDPNWAQNYKITHRPDRPRQDKREALKSRNSVYVLGQLNRIWRHNKKMVEEKKRERRARERALAAEFAHLSSQDQMDRDDQRDQQRDTRGSSIDHESQLPGLQTDLASNFRLKALPSELTRNEWRADHHRRSTYPPSSPSASSDRMTIRVGLELQSSEGVETGGHSYAHETPPPPLPLLAPMTFTPLTVPLRPASASISSAPRGPSARKRQTRSLSRSPSQRTPLANAMQAPDARSKALRETMKLYINTDQDSTPSLVNSSPVSEQASPLTPIEDVSDEGGLHRKFLPADPQQAKACPMPLCGSLLLTAVDREQNLCAECRSDLQPRQSIFTTDLLNPFPSPYSPINTYASSRTPLISDTQHDLPAKAAAAKYQEVPETTHYINSESKTRRENRSSGDRSVDRDRVQATEAAPSSPKIKINNSYVLSRFNKDRGDFKLQSAPPSRRHTHRRREQQLGHSPVERRTAKQSSTSGRSNHIGFQLAGWRTTALLSPTTPQASPRRAARNPKQRKASGPLLEAKTFRPATPPTRQKKNSPNTHRRLSDSRSRTKVGGSVTGSRRSDGRASSLPRVRVGDTVVSRGNMPTPSSAPPRRKHHSNPDRLKYRDSSTKTRETEEKPHLGEEKKIVEDDIYHDIESIIDCYLRLPDAPEPDNERRKADAVASYFSAVPLDVEMKIKGFF
ncbi:hypothetical protein F5Y12DRAFT_411477 [Xylaria sp. FL1777]|nr:hypothetical protein F5Y12DRAFT_411477 [Xylaria sp. FL1777]